MKLNSTWIIGKLKNYKFEYLNHFTPTKSGFNHGSIAVHVNIKCIWFNILFVPKIRQIFQLVMFFKHPLIKQHILKRRGEHCYMRGLVVTHVIIFFYFEVAESIPPICFFMINRKFRLLLSNPNFKN